MLVVNTPGTWAHVFAPLLHAEWHGCSPTDLVFPSFLFIIGVSMWFSFEKYGRTLNKALWLKIGKRAALLFALGLLLAWFPFWGKNLSELRILGVLQRLGLCYGLAAILVLSLSPRLLIAVAVAILLGYWGAMVWAAMPFSDPYGLEGNLVRRIDLAVLGPQHLWKGKGIPFDPEGLLSTLPATVNVLMGWWAAQMMQKNQANPLLAVRNLSLWGAGLVVAAQIWHLGFPINKSLWTSSFVLNTSGIAMLVLAFSIWVLDVQKWRKGVSFWLVFGSNPLFAYILSGLLVKTLMNIKWAEGEQPTNALQWVYRTFFVPIEPYKTGSFLFALVFLLICWSVCWVLYRKKIFIKI